MKFRSWLANLLYNWSIQIRPRIDTIDSIYEDMSPNGPKLADAASMNLSPDQIALDAFRGLLAAGNDIDVAAGNAYTSCLVAFLMKREEYWRAVIETASLTPWLIPSNPMVETSQSS